MGDQFTRPAGPNAEIVPATPEARPGERLVYGVRNLGPEAISFGEMFALERAEGAGWARCRLPYAFRAIGYSLEPGEERELAVWVPPEARPGRYRVSKDIRVGAEPGRCPAVRMAFEFAIL